MVFLLLAGCPKAGPEVCVEEGRCGADNPDGHDVYTTACEDPAHLIPICTPGGEPAPACATAGNACEVGSPCIDNDQCTSEICAVEPGESEGICVATTSAFGGTCPPNHRLAEERDTDPTAVCLPTPCDDPSCRIVEVETSFNHHCMRDAGGAVYCWLGGSPGAPLPGIDDAIDLDGDVDRVCVVRASGETVCMYLGQAPSPIAARGLVQLALGGDHSCGVTAAGEVLCWGGENQNGQLGDGTFSPSSTPVTVVALDDAVAVAVGPEHSCALRQGGQVVCWGRGDMLGAGTFQPSTAAPLPVPGVDDATDLAIGTTTCAVRSSGVVTCWNETPAEMTGLSPMTGLDGGSFLLDDGRPWGFLCGVLATGRVACWSTGGIPTPDDDPLPAQPQELRAEFDGPAPSWETRPLEGAVDVARSQLTACALLASGEVMCGTSTTLRPVAGTRPR